MGDLEHLCNQAYSSNSIACINSVNIDSIQKGIVKVLQQERLEQISKPPLTQNSKVLHFNKLNMSEQRQNIHIEAKKKQQEELIF